MIRPLEVREDALDFLPGQHHRQLPAAPSTDETFEPADLPPQYSPVEEEDGAQGLGLASASTIALLISLPKACTLGGNTELRDACALFQTQNTLFRPACTMFWVRKTSLWAQNMLVWVQDKVLRTADTVFRLPCDVFRTADTVFRFPCDALRTADTVFRLPCDVLRTADTVFRLPCDVLRTADTVFRLPRDVLRTADTLFRLPRDVLRTADTLFCLPCDVFRTADTLFRLPCDVLRTADTVFRLLRDVLRTACTVFRSPCAIRRAPVHSPSRELPDLWVGDEPRPAALLSSPQRGFKVEHPPLGEQLGGAWHRSPVLGVAAILAEDPQYRPAFRDRSPCPLFLTASYSMWRTLYDVAAHLNP